VFAVAYSPDGKQLAAASSDETVVVRDPAGGATLFTCVGHAGGFAAWRTAPTASCWRAAAGTAP
jgi:WD40 repeat protein